MKRIVPTNIHHDSIEKLAFAHLGQENEWSKRKTPVQYQIMNVPSTVKRYSGRTEGVPQDKRCPRKLQTYST